jgi:hypothetical protein
MEIEKLNHCRKCLAYYPNGEEHHCVSWIVGLVELWESQHGKLDNPHFECRVCFPDGNCPEECIKRNHHINA